MLPSLFTLSSWHSYSALYTVIILCYPAMFCLFLSSHSAICFWLFWGIPRPLLIFNDTVSAFIVYQVAKKVEGLLYFSALKDVSECWRFKYFVFMFKTSNTLKCILKQMQQQSRLVVVFHNTNINIFKTFNAENVFKSGIGWLTKWLNKISLLVHSLNYS
jgi:hypothetical protein